MHAIRLIILVLSVGLQLLAAIQAARQLKRSGRFLPFWTAISVALFLMVIRRLIPLLSVLEDPSSFEVAESPVQSITGLAISILMTAGVFGLKQHFLQLRNDADKLAQLSVQDPLTGLSNRRHALEWGEHALRTAKRYGHPLSVLMIDIDRFKTINDRYGHETGDRALQFVAESLHALTRTVDLQCRWGGEEFLILLPEIRRSEARRVAERIRRHFEKNSSKTAPAFTVSIGVTGNLSGDESLPAIISRSDRAMYRAKHAGRNRVCSL